MYHVNTLRGKNPQGHTLIHIYTHVYIHIFNPMITEKGKKRFALSIPT